MSLTRVSQDLKRQWADSPCCALLDRPIPMPNCGVERRQSRLIPAAGTRDHLASCPGSDAMVRGPLQFLSPPADVSSASRPNIWSEERGGSNRTMTVTRRAFCQGLAFGGVALMGRRARA